MMQYKYVAQSLIAIFYITLFTENERQSYLQHQADFIIGNLINLANVADDAVIPQLN